MDNTQVHFPKECWGVLQEMEDTQDWYPVLLRQLDKDFARAGIPLPEITHVPPKELALVLERQLTQLWERQHQDLRQLLYLMDIHEKDITAVLKDGASVVPQRLVGAVLRRELRKIHYRQQYGRR